MFVAVLASACGPLVPIDAATDGADTGATTGADDDGDGRPVDTGEADGRPSDGEVGEVDGGEDVDTGMTGACGDGVLDPGEICDDGNASPGDGCELDCTTTAGLLVWSQTVDGDGSNDAARAVAIAPSGDVLVAGSVRIAGSDDAWLHAFAPDGATLGDHVADLGNDAFATAIAITPDARTYVAGVQPSSDRAVLLRLDESVLVEIDGAATDILAFTALAASTSQGFAVVTNAGDFDEIIATVRRYDSAGAVIDDVALEPDVFVGASAPALLGGTILGGGSFGDMGMGSTAWWMLLDAEGTPIWSSTVAADPEVQLRLRGIAMAPDGSIVAVGTREVGGPMDDDDTGWIWWWDAAGELTSDGPLDIGGAAARPTSVVVGAHGIVVGGTVIEKDDGFVAGYAPDGTLQWGFELAGDLDLEDGIAALAVAPGLGIVAVGWITQSTTNQDAWVGVFTD